VLDVGRLIKLRPDLVRYGPAGRPVAVVDAKYKAETPAGYPYADLYQLLAYCTALQLPIGHLVYAEGEAEAARHRITHAGITIVQHALNLRQPVRALLAQVAGLAAEIAAQRPAA
jgi:5-methylcytosine-specific restriction enzyme subunit McrC